MQTAEQVRQTWRQRVTPKLVPGSELEHHASLPHGHRFELLTPQLPYAEVNKRHDKVAAALDVAREELRIAPGSSEGRAWVTVITNNPLVGTLPYQGPEYVALPDENVLGAVPMGPTLDGGEGYAVIEDSSGVYGGVFSGDPGSGKSTAFAQLGAGLLRSGVWFPVYCDGDQQANSSAFLNEHMPIAGAGENDAWDQLAAIEDAVQTRGHVKNALIEHVDTGEQRVWLDAEVPTGWRKADRIKPSGEFPGIAWMLDEFSLLTRDARFAGRVLAVVRIARKLGIAVFVSTQSLKREDFGSTTLRGFLVSRNLFAFHAENQQEKTALPNRGIDPGKLPTGGGFAFYSRSQASAVRMRTRFTRDMAGCVAGLRAPGLDERTGAHFAGLAREPDAARLDSIDWLQQQDQDQDEDGDELPWSGPGVSRVVAASRPVGVWSSGDATQPIPALEDLFAPEEPLRPWRLVSAVLMVLSLLSLLVLARGLVLFSRKYRGWLGVWCRAAWFEVQVAGQHVWCWWSGQRAEREERSRILA